MPTASTQKHKASALMEGLKPNPASQKIGCCNLSSVKTMSGCSQIFIQ